MWRKLITWKTVSIFAALALISGSFAWSFIDNANRPTIFNIKSPCNLHAGACLAIAETDEKIEFSVTLQETPLLEPLQLSVKLHKLKAESIAVRFTGVDYRYG